MAIQFQRATRRSVKIKMLLKGPTGAGKTFGALHIADGIAPGKIVLIDSEHDRSNYYADVLPFDNLSLTTFHPKAYIEAIHAAVAAGYEVLIIDSLSHCWLDLLERKDAYDKANPRSNQWTNWALFGEEWDDLIRTILEAPIHVICTARSKMAHEQVEVSGKKQVMKLGLAPQLRENTEYEFSIAFDVEQTTDKRHPAQVSKDNTNLLSEAGKVWNLVDGSVPALIRQWLATAKPIERPSAETLKALDDAMLALPEETQARVRRRVAERKQRGLPEDEAVEILAQIKAMVAPTTPTPPAPATAPAAAVETTAAPVNTATTAEALRAGAEQSLSLDDALSMQVATRGGNVIIGELDLDKLGLLKANAEKRGNLLVAAACGRAMAFLQEHAQQEGTPPVQDADLADVDREDEDYIP